MDCRKDLSDPSAGDASSDKSDKSDKSDVVVIQIYTAQQSLIIVYLCCLEL